MNTTIITKVTDGWRLARFDQILRRIERKIILDDSVSYSCVGVRWYGMGAFVREHLFGMDIARKQQWIIKAGDVVYNKLFAWKGAFAIADSAVDGCIVSDKFPTYEADLEVIDLRFLEYYFRTPIIARQAQDLSKGAAAISKLTLNPPQFWDLTIPLPPLDEQRRIVARIEELSAKIEEARSLRHNIEQEDRMLSSLIASSLMDNPEWRWQTVEELVGRVNLKNGISLKSNGNEAGVRCLRLSSLRAGRVDCSDTKPVPMTIEEAGSYAIRRGDVFIVRGNGSKDLVGRAGVVDESHSGVIFPDLFIRVPLDQDKMLAPFFVLAWNSKAVRNTIEEIAKTTSGIWKINQGHIASISVPVPPLTEQRRIVTYLDDIQAKIDTLKKIQKETAEELDALMPSILSRAFSGAL